MHSDRRRATRLNLTKQYDARVRLGRSTFNVCHIRQLSLTGAQIECPYAADGKVVQLAFCIQGRPLSVQAAVAWCKPSRDGHVVYGLRFEGIQACDRRFYENWFEIRRLAWEHRQAV